MIWSVTLSFTLIGNLTCFFFWLSLHWFILIFLPVLIGHWFILIFLPILIGHCDELLVFGLNTQINRLTPKSDYYVTSPYSIPTLYSKQIMRTL